MKIVIRIFAIFVILLFLIPALLLVIESIVNPDKIPGLFGYKPLIVMSGSMEPVFEAGDLAIAKDINPDDVKVGDIVAFLSENDHTVITHRVSEVTQDEYGITVFKTKGDANNVEDPWTISKDRVQGLYVSRIKNLGYVILFLQTPAGLLGMILIVVIIGGGLYLIENNNINAKLRAENERMKKEINKS